jgi:transcriptional regulator with XRE-family HTH domain
MIAISLGKGLHELRDKADLSLRELAKKVGISSPFLSDIELGRRFSSEEILAKLASALNVSLEADENLAFRYIQAYLIEGLQAPRGGTKEIYSDEALGKKVFLTDRSAAIWDHFDRAQSLAYSILTTVVGISTLDANSVSARLSEGEGRKTAEVQLSISFSSY